MSVAELQALTGLVDLDEQISRLAEGGRLAAKPSLALGPLRSTPSSWHRATSQLIRRRRPLARGPGGRRLLAAVGGRPPWPRWVPPWAARLPSSAGWWGRECCASSPRWNGCLSTGTDSVAGCRKRLGRSSSERTGPRAEADRRESGSAGDRGDPAARDDRLRKNRGLSAGGAGDARPRPLGNPAGAGDCPGAALARTAERWFGGELASSTRVWAPASATRSGSGAARRGAGGARPAQPFSPPSWTSGSWGGRGAGLVYKQEIDPRYNARDLALVRGRDAGAVTLLVSATPSLESRFNAERGSSSW